MNRRRSDPGWRAAAWAAALFAITLNFLQPLAHAALMRDGSPSTLWTAMCLPSLPKGDGQQQDDHRPASTAAPHECCLGLAHAPTLAEPSAAFVAIDRPAVTVRPLETAQALTPVSIRDGPSQPRAPPFLA
ncbi:MAG: DUF2946 family protein [Reyranella sp.]|nr:DUF2946 family protein [Reyranella sp.]MBL6651408.1 DUF2946 family protein [Reyranella sp.]